MDFKFFAFCALDDSSLRIGRVKASASVAAVAEAAGERCKCNIRVVSYRETLMTPLNKNNGDSQHLFMATLPVWQV